MRAPFSPGGSLENHELLSTFHTFSLFLGGHLAPKKVGSSWVFPAYLSSGGVPGSGGSVSWRSHGLKMEDRRSRHRPDVEHNGMVKDRRNFPNLIIRRIASVYPLHL